MRLQICFNTEQIKYMNKTTTKHNNKTQQQKYKKQFKNNQI